MPTIVGSGGAGIDPANYRIEDPANHRIRGRASRTHGDHHPGAIDAMGGGVSVAYATLAVTAARA
jgi:hypothetical protein